MSEGLRWKLILGCLVLAALQAPESALVLVQDLKGPWRSDLVLRDVAKVPDRPLLSRQLSPGLKPRRADASVAPEELLGLDRTHPSRFAPGDIAILFAP